MGGAKHRWRLSFHRAPSSSPTLKLNQKKHTEPPKEFLCPISGTLMADPVIVSSGHTLERSCVHACKALNFLPAIGEFTTDFSAIIPNLALKSAILNWCDNCSVEKPTPVESTAAEQLVRSLMASAQGTPTNRIRGEEGDDSLLERVSERNHHGIKFTHAATELTRRRNHFRTSSDESVATVDSAPPLQLATRPSCYSSSSSSEIEILNPNFSSPEEEEIAKKLKSPQVFEQEETLISLRKMTRTREELRVSLCTPPLLSALRSLIMSRYTVVQVNAVAALVNLSLENPNKVKIVRSGIVPPLIDVLQGGSTEAQEHASGALFSLALDDNNKTAIGVLGALPPLLHVLRSGTERARHDSALALYHLSLVQSNRIKLVKLGAVQPLLSMLRPGPMLGRVLLILCNLAACSDGRAAMLDGGAIEHFVHILGENESNPEPTRESCVIALYLLSHGGLRFKGLAKEAGVVEVLQKVIESASGSERGREKARRVLELMKGKEKEDEDVDWEELLGLRLTSRTQSRLGSSGLGAKSTEF